MKILAHTFFIASFVLITFFGLGPVLLADGVREERIITAVVVFGIYGILTLGYLACLKWLNKKQK